MATFKQGIMVVPPGKVASIAGYQPNGQWVMKSLPKPQSINKKDLQQKAFGFGFARMQHFLKPLITFITVGYKL